MESTSEIQKQNLKYISIVYLLLCHVGALIGACYVLTFNIRLSTAIISILALICNALGVTAGMHRLWSHRSYSAKWPFRFFLMLCASIANQGSIYHWVRDHRIHHRYSEQNQDPHNAKKGFFYSHVGWLLVTKRNDTIEEGKKLNLDDLHNDSFVMWQKSVHPWFDLFMCFTFPAVMCYIFGEPFWIGLFVAGTLRYVLVLHFTWLVNSAAHIWGDRPYNPSIGPAENLFVALLSGGEGYHNWHHTYPFDYANSEIGFLKQWNPTKLVIDLAAKIGLVSNRRRAKWNKNKQK